MTIRLALALGLGLLSAPSSAQVVERGSDLFRKAPVEIKLDAIPTNSLVVMLMRDVMRVPYVIQPDVLKDARPVSVNLTMKRDDIPLTVVRFVRSLGFEVTLRSGTVYVGAGKTGSGFSDPMQPAPDAAAPVASASPLAPAAPQAASAEPPAPRAAFAYVPSHRDPAYLATVLQPLFPAALFGPRDQARSSAPEQTVATLDPVDILLVSGLPDDLERIRLAIAALDRPRALVAVKAVVMQVSSGESRGSALSVIASLAGDRLQVRSFADALPGAQQATLAVGAVQAVLSAVKEDNRFKVVASPNISVLSGSSAVINAGSQVPTLGAVVVTDGGSTQSVVYRDSGITLDVRPTERGGLIYLDVRQERSNFVPTSNGVDNSPTLQTASVTAQSVLAPGESVILAGLSEDSASNVRQGIFGGLLGVRSREKSESELVVVLQADLVPVAAARPGEFLSLDPPPPEVL